MNSWTKSIPLAETCQEEEEEDEEEEKEEEEEEEEEEESFVWIANFSGLIMALHNVTKIKDV